MNRLIHGVIHSLLQRVAIVRCQVSVSGSRAILIYKLQDRFQIKTSSFVESSGKSFRKIHI
jgi:hypothetical protein